MDFSYGDLEDRNGHKQTDVWMIAEQKRTAGASQAAGSARFERAAEGTRDY